MAVFTVEKLASLCKVDQETIRRWRNRGVNGVKLQATTNEIQRGVALMFQDDAVRTFMQANPKYMTKELDRILNGDFEPALGAASVPEAPKVWRTAGMSGRFSKNSAKTCWANCGKSIGLWNR